MTTTQISFIFCGQQGNPIQVEAGKCHYDMNPKAVCEAYKDRDSWNRDKTAFCLDDNVSGRPYGDSIDINSCQKCSSCREEKADDGSTYTICNWEKVDLNQCENDHGRPKGIKPKTKVAFFDRSPEALCKKSIDIQDQLADEKLALPPGTDTSDWDRRIIEATESVIDSCLAVPPLEQPEKQLPSAMELVKAVKAHGPMPGESDGLITLEMNIDFSQCQCSNPCECDLSGDNPLNAPGDYSLAFGADGLCADGADCGNFADRDAFCQAHPGYGYTACTSDGNHPGKCTNGSTPALCPPCADHGYCTYGVRLPSPTGCTETQDEGELCVDTSCICITSEIEKISYCEPGYECPAVPTTEELNSDPKLQARPYGSVRKYCVKS